MSVDNRDQKFGGMEEHAEDVEGREDEAMEALYGKKVGDRMVYQDGQGNVDTDWNLASINEDSEGNVEATISRTKRGDKAEIRTVDYNKVKDFNFQGSEDIVDNIKDKIKKRELKEPMLYDPKESERGIASPQEKRIAEARNTLRDFLKGDYTTTMDLLRDDMSELSHKREDSLEVFNKIAERLDNMKESLGVDNVDSRASDLEQLEDGFRRASERFQDNDRKLKEVKGHIKTLKKKIREKPLS